jgi:hypothetical protein
MCAFVHAWKTGALPAAAPIQVVQSDPSRLQNRLCGDVSNLPPKNEYEAMTIYEEGEYNSPAGCACQVAIIILQYG